MVVASAHLQAELRAESERSLCFRSSCAEAARSLGVFVNLAPFEAELAAVERRMSRYVAEDQRFHNEIDSVKTRLSEFVE